MILTIQKRWPALLVNEGESKTSKVHCSWLFQHIDLNIHHDYGSWGLTKPLTINHNDLNILNATKIPSWFKMFKCFQGFHPPIPRRPPRPVRKWRVALPVLHMHLAFAVSMCSDLLIKIFIQSGELQGVLYGFKNFHVRFQVIHIQVLVCQQIGCAGLWKKLKYALQKESWDLWISRSSHNDLPPFALVVECKFCHLKKNELPKILPSKSNIKSNGTLCSPKKNGALRHCVQVASLDPFGRAPVLEAPANNSLDHFKVWRSWNGAQPQKIG